MQNIMVTLKRIIILYVIVMFISGSAIYSRNEDELHKAVIRKELHKGDFTDIQITGHRETKKVIIVFVTMKDVANKTKSDTLSFNLTGDGYINE